MQQLAAPTLTSGALGNDREPINPCAAILDEVSAVGLHPMELIGVYEATRNPR
jgi:hypothetical protein